MLNLKSLNLRKATILIGLSATLFSPLQVAADEKNNPKRLYVDGNMQSKKGDGTKSSPVSSLIEARDAVRKLRGKGYKGKVEVIIAPGNYIVSESLKLDKRDSFVTYKCEEGAYANFFGGTILDSKWFKPIGKNSAFASRLVDKDVAENILVADLKAQGIRDFGEITSHGWNLESPHRVPPAMLSISGEQMTLARWPNADEVSPYLIDLKNRMANLGIQPEELKGFVSYSEIVDKGVGLFSLKGEEKKKWYESERFMNGGGTAKVHFDRMSEWEDTGEIFVNGVLSATWEWVYNRVVDIDKEKREFKLEMGTAMSGLGDKVKVSHFFFENVAEELDREGEYYIDRENGLLYLYPPAELHNKTIVLSSLKEPMIVAESAANIRIENISFDTGRNFFAVLNKTNKFEVINCTIANFVKGGIQSRGNNNLFRGNEIRGIGGYGILIDGGDTKTLRAGGNVAEYNHIHDFAWDQKSQMPGLYLQGVGNKIAHNKIHNAPHFAIRMTYSNDNIIEYNEIYDVVKYHHFDGGALYVYNTMQPEMRGNSIRYNYFHDICNKRNGVYIDNHSMGVNVEGNLFVRVERAVNINSGHHNIVHSNVMVDCAIPVRVSKFSYNTPYIDGNFRERWREIANTRLGNIENMPHKKYKDLLEWIAMSDDQKRLGVSYSRNNIFYRPEGDGFADELGSMVKEGNIITNTDPGFEDIKKENYNLDYNKEALKLQIDFDKMGLCGVKTGAR